MAGLGRGMVFTVEAPVAPITPTYKFVCAEEIAAGEVVCQSKTQSGYALLAKADDTDRMPAFAVATEGGDAGDTIAVQQVGAYSNVSRTEDFDLQEAVWVSTTLGKATKNPPAAVGCGQQRIGIARGAGYVMLAFDLTIIWVG